MTDSSWELLPADAPPPVPAAPDELFVSPAWTGMLAACYRWTIRYAVQSAPRKVVPFVVLDDLAGRRVSAYPFSDYLPLKVDEAVALGEVLRVAFPQHRTVIKCIGSAADLPHQAGRSVVRQAVAHRYHSADACPSASFRRGTRKAERAGIHIRRRHECAALERFVELYYRQRHQKFSSLPQPLHFFDRLQAEFVHVGNGFFHEAVYQDRVIASQVILRQGNGWFYKFGTSDTDGLSLRPNNLLFSRLTQAVDHGEAAFLDLGLSGNGAAYEGLRRFKSALGAHSFPLVYLADIPPGYDTEQEDALRKLTGRLVGNWTEQSATPPQAATNALSRALYPLFA